jgi:hypothetical protein
MEHLSNPLVQAGGLIVGGAALSVLSLLSRPSAGEANKDELDLQHKEAHEARAEGALFLAPCIAAGTYNSLRDALRQRGIPAAVAGSMSLSVDLSQFIRRPEPEAENELYDVLLSHGLVLQPGVKRGEFHICIPSVSRDLLADILSRFDAFIKSSRPGQESASSHTPKSSSSANTGSYQDEIKAVDTPSPSNLVQTEEKDHVPEDASDVVETIVEPAPSRRGRKSVAYKAAASASDEEGREADASTSSVGRSRAGRTPSKRKSLALDESSDAGDVKTIRRRKAV